MLKELAISAVLPLVGVALGVWWKELLKDKLNIEDRLVILELLVATLTLTVAIWVNDNDARSVEARAVAGFATVFIGIGVLPVVGKLVKGAYNPDHRPKFTEEEARWANACGAWIFSVAYFFTHI